MKKIFILLCLGFYLVGCATTTHIKPAYNEVEIEKRVMARKAREKAQLMWAGAGAGIGCGLVLGNKKYFSVGGAVLTIVGCSLYALGVRSYFVKEPYENQELENTFIWSGTGVMGVTAVVSQIEENSRGLELLGVLLAPIGSGVGVIVTKTINLFGDSQATNKTDAAEKVREKKTIN